MGFLTATLAALSASASAAPLCAQNGVLDMRLEMPRGAQTSSPLLLALTFERLPEHARITISSDGQFVGAITNFGGRSTGSYLLSMPLLKTAAGRVDIELRSGPSHAGLPVQDFCIDKALLRATSGDTFPH
jgi:hypothetical protein